MKSTPVHRRPSHAVLRRRLDPFRVLERSAHPEEPFVGLVADITSRPSAPPPPVGAALPLRSGSLLPSPRPLPSPLSGNHTDHEKTYIYLRSTADRRAPFRACVSVCLYRVGRSGPVLLAKVRRARSSPRIEVRRALRTRRVLAAANVIQRFFARPPSSNLLPGFRSWKYIGLSPYRNKSDRDGTGGIVGQLPERLMRSTAINSRCLG